MYTRSTLWELLDTLDTIPDAYVRLGEYLDERVQHCLVDIPAEQYSALSVLMTVGPMQVRFDSHDLSQDQLNALCAGLTEFLRPRAN